MEKRLLESLGSDSEGEDEEETKKDANLYDSSDGNVFLREVKSALSSESFSHLCMIMSSQKDIPTQDQPYTKVTLINNIHI